MASKNLELVLKIRAENAAELNKTLAAIKGIDVEVREGAAVVGKYEAAWNNVGATLKDAASASGVAAGGIDRASGSLTAGVVKGTLFAEVIKKAAEALKAATYDATLYAARTETLQISTDQLAKANNLNTTAIRGLVAQVKALGITTQEANSTIQKMIFAELDLAKATQLARLAQDAAVIAGVNSSEALENIILGITTGMTRLLHTMGLQVSAEQTWVRARREAGRELTEREKRETLLQEVLKEGVKIQGTYEAAMTTTGKRLTSLSRYVDEAKNAVGREFTPVLGVAVEGLTSLAKFVEHNAATLAALAKAVGLAAVAFGVFKLGAVIGELVLMGGAVTGLTAAWNGLTAAIARNPIGLLLVGATIALGILVTKMQEMREEMDKLFDIDDGAARKLTETLDKIAEKMAKGKASAEDFKKAIQDALNEGQNEKKGLGGVMPMGMQAPDMRRDMNFRTFIQEEFKLNPDDIAQLAEDGNKAGQAIARSLTRAYMEAMKPGAVDHGIKVIMPPKPAELEALKEKFEKEVKKAAEDVKQLRDQQTLAELDGVQKVNAARQITLEKLGKTRELVAQINEIFDRTVVLETKNHLAKALDIPPEVLRSLHTAREVLDRIQASLAARQQSWAKKHLEDTGQLPKERDEIKFGAEAYEFASKQFKSSLEKAIQADEKFLSETKKVIEGFREVEEARIAADLAGAQSAAARQERLISLTMSPGGEVVAGDRIGEVRRRTAQLEFEAAKRTAEERMRAALTIAQTEQEKSAARLRYEADMIQANGQLRNKILDVEFEKTARVMELRRQEVENFRNAAGQVFDAMTRNGSSGLRDFISGYVKTIQRTIFMNSAEELYRGMRDRFKLAVPGQTDGQGNLTWLGRILRGTPFGVDPVKLAQEANTNATRDNTLATKVLTRTILEAKAAPGTVTGVSGTGDALGGLLDTVLGAGEGSGGTSGGSGGKKSAFGRIFSEVVRGFMPAMLGGGPTGGLFAGLRGGDYSIQTGPGQATTASAAGQTSTAARAANVASSAVTVAKGAYDAYQGFKEGGAKGNLAGTSSILNVASQIPGPQQPFIAAAAAITSMISWLLPDKRVQRDKEINDFLNKSRVVRTGSDVTTDLAGNSIDYDFRGNLRTFVVNRVEVNVDAIDSKSFLERSRDIGAAVAKEIGLGNDPLRNAVQSAAFA